MGSCNNYYVYGFRFVGDWTLGDLLELCCHVTNLVLCWSVEALT